MVCRLWISRRLGGLCPRTNPNKLLEGEAIALLVESQGEKFLKDEKLVADEYTLFRILQAWGSAREEKDGGQDATAADVPTSRKRAAQHMSKYISLERIKPADLSRTVTSYGLMTVHSYCEAYKETPVSACCLA
jgi:hypothetical protein